MAELKIIYEDDDILVCHKMAGMATEGSRAGEMDVISAARNLISRRNRSTDTGRQRNLPPYVATVNRLDKPVEGVLVLAKNKKAATSLTEQIREKTAGKHYYALCYGIPEVNMQTLSDKIIRREDNKKALVVTDEEAASIKDGVITLGNGLKVRLIGGDVKDAELTYEIIGRNEKTALLRIELKTGRFHQIRAQMSHMGFPIVGDTDYGTQESIKYSRDNGISCVCLAAYMYEIRHPSTGREMSFRVRPENAAIRELLR